MDRQEEPIISYDILYAEAADSPFVVLLAQSSQDDVLEMLKISWTRSGGSSETWGMAALKVLC